MRFMVTIDGLVNNKKTNKMRTPLEFLDRMGIASISNPEILRHKVGGSVSAVRRTGGMETDNMLNNVILFREMIIVVSNYWNMVYERDAGEVLNDDEGIVNIKKSVKIRPGRLRKSIILMTFLFRVKCLGVLRLF